MKYFLQLIRCEVARKKFWIRPIISENILFTSSAPVVGSFYD